MKYLFEVFDDIKAAQGDKNKIVDILSENKSSALAVALMANYGHPVSTMDPDNIPEYKPDDSPEGMSFTTMTKEIQKIDYFFKPGREINKESQNRLYINICEGLHPREAELFTDIILKRLYIDGLDYRTINEGFGEDFMEEPERILENVD